jgi:dUTPase
MAFRKKIDLQLKRLDPSAVVPAYAHPGEDAALDMVVTSVKYDKDLDAYIYGTGWACATDSQAAMLCFPRSSIYKTNFYLTNSVGVVDTKGYRGEIKAIFKHRDSLQVRCYLAALSMHEQNPGCSIQTLMNTAMDEFIKDPMKYAPYKVGERAFQIILTKIDPVEVEVVDELDMNTNRGIGGHGSTGK